MAPELPPAPGTLPPLASKDNADLTVRLKTVHAKQDALRLDLQLPTVIDQRVVGVADISIGDIVFRTIGDEAARNLRAAFIGSFDPDVADHSDMA